MGNELLCSCHKFSAGGNFSLCSVRTNCFIKFWDLDLKVYKIRIILVIVVSETISIPVEEYKLLKKKEAIADDIILQLDASLNAIERGKVKRVL